jgi:ubiquinone/menaquinone biosynthesis C-methylase UbiE
MTATRPIDQWTEPTEFSDDYFAMMAELEDRHPWTQSMRQLTLDLLRKKARGKAHRIMDAGCGTGLFLSECRKAVGASVAVGVDLFPAALRLARKRTPADWLAGSAAELPFRPESFDLIHCADVLQHMTLQDSERAFDAFAAILKPGGILGLRVRAPRVWERLPQVDYSQYFTTGALRKGLQARSFRVLFLSHVNALPSLWAEIRTREGRQQQNTAVRGISTGEIDRPKSRVLSAYLSLERKWLLGTGIPMPMGHTIICLAQKAG